MAQIVNRQMSDSDEATTRIAFATAFVLTAMFMDTFAQKMVNAVDAAMSAAYFLFHVTILGLVSIFIFTYVEGFICGLINYGR